MKNLFTKALAAVSLSLVFIVPAQAIPVTINMTADNIIASGGVCFDASCQDGIGWADFGNTDNFENWTQSSSFVLDLGVGTHYFAWEVVNVGNPSSGNPAALLAEILWDSGANYSSSAWEIYDVDTGTFIASATEYGANGQNIWGGPVAGISTNANWIYTANNFANADSSAWIRTHITITSVPEPGSLLLLGLGLAGLGMSRRRVKAA